MEDSNHINPRREILPIGRSKKISESPNDEVKEKREQYCKMTLLMFPPIIESIDKLQCNESYWTRFDEFWKDHFGRKKGHSPQLFELLPNDDE